MTKEESKWVEKHGLEWKVNTVGLLNEIGNNPGTGILKIPLRIFGNILAEAVERSIEINDPVLNHVMCKLALYEESDLYSKEYNKKAVDKVAREYRKYKRKKP